MTLADQCVEQLNQAILEGDLPPGAPLKMAELKERLGVGLSPIREALSRLVSSGMVEVHGMRGFRVAPLTMTHTRELFDAYHQLEGLLLSLAMERGDTDWEAGIMAALHKLKRVECGAQPTSFAEFAPLNAAFHFALVSGCGSPSLLQLREQLYRQFDRCIRLAFAAWEQPLSLNHDEHQRLAEAVIARDKERAQRLLHEHIMGGVPNVIEQLKQRGFS